MISTNRTFASSAGDIITRLVLIAVACVGIAVILGWHLHVRVLVQVFSGTIPMQYNTALCFIVLAASGWLLVARRGHWIGSVVGGALVALMGALVIYEYASGHSIGIDTLFFYPWLRTLSAEPGRMALTSAMSFVSAGAALALLSFRRTATATFAILHTVPLSLGLTSVMGYFAGITFVLPLNLGSQMAVHTSFSFFAYGSVMLVYAWRHSAQTTEGVPRWVPAIGVLTVPILFVGFSVTTGHGSARDWTALLIMGLIAAGLFAVATHTLSRGNINRKGLTLVSVPLVFLFVFVLLVTQLSRKSHQAEQWHRDSKEVIATVESISTDLFDSESSIRGYVITGDPAFAELFEGHRRTVPDKVARLKGLVQDNPEQERRATDLGAKAANKLAFQASIEQLVKGGDRDGAIQSIKTARGLQLMNEFRETKEAFLNEAQRLDNERRHATEASWQGFDWLLVAGSSIGVVLAIILAILFSTGISKRIVVLTKNTQALARGDALSEPVSGTDEIAHLDHVFREMAEALAAAARKERAIFENALDVVCTADDKGRFLRVSPSCLRVWGYSPEEMIGRPYTDFLVAEEVEKSQQAEREVLKGTALTNFENRYRRKDGTEVTMLWSAWWSESDRTIFATARDITERKRAEHAVKELNASLEKRSAQLEQANKELEAFSYSVSHDLRAPLRAIDGFSRILIEDHSDKFDADAARVLNVIRGNTQNMGRLIDDLLAFSRLGRKPIERSQIDMNELARDVFAQVRSDDSAPAIRFDLEPLHPSDGDPSMIRQVFANLFSNAAKYSRKKGAALIEVGSYSQNGEHVYYVKDNGVGFDMSYSDKLFGVFQRLHSAEEFEGTGVGLAIVQRIIHRHGGRVWAEGKVNEGATFYFTLPKEHETDGNSPKHE